MENNNQESSPKAEKNYLFVGNCKARTNKFNTEEINLGFNASNLNLLLENVNENGWVNIAMRRGKYGMYMYIINPKTEEHLDND
jgi:hypothetical protein